MGGGGGGGSPAYVPPPEILAPAPSTTTKGTKDAARKRQGSLAAVAVARGDTILTSPTGGVDTGSAGAGKTLLGS